MPQRSVAVLRRRVQAEWDRAVAAKDTKQFRQCKALIAELDARGAH